MNFRPVILVFCLVSLLPGCGKIRNPLRGGGEVERTPEPVAAATPVPAPTPEATPEPEPTPAPAPVVDKTAQVIVLCYHRFEEKPKDSLAISPADFEAQMQGLKDAGISVISMNDFLAWRRGEKSIPARSAILSIDDGYVSGYSVAWPILQKFGYPFTMFVYTNYIGVGGKSITWAQLEEMRDAGVDIGSHTVSHQDLRARKGKTEEQYRAWLTNELKGSKDMIEQRLGIRVTTLAYPFGLSNEEVRKAGIEAGYETLFSVHGMKVGHGTPSEAVGRYAIESTKPEVFRLALNFGPGGEAPSSTAAVSVAAASMVTRPMEGETVTDARPVISANLATFGEIDPASVEMRVSGIGVVPAQYDAASRTVTYRPTQKLVSESCSVIVSAKSAGKKVQARWTFQVRPASAAL
jgi:peptidoglycan/xylan/chitin deacetylase (PgdA/CDA1 family)